MKKISIKGITLRLRDSAILSGMKKIGDNKYKIGEEDWGAPVIVDRETMISELMWIGLSEKKANRLVKKLDRKYKIMKGKNDRIRN